MLEGTFTGILKRNTAVKRLRMRELLSELSFQLVQKTEEKYISGRLHEALEKRVNKITMG